MEDVVEAGVGAGAFDRGDVEGFFDDADGDWSRLGSEQMWQVGSSVMSAQVVQSLMRCLTPVMASESSAASASGIRTRWYARRCADLGPMPGSRRKASMTRATGAATPRGASDGGETGVIDLGGSGRNAAIGVGWLEA